MSHFNSQLNLEFQTISKELFQNLKSTDNMPCLREKNSILENDINTDFQTILFDYVNIEQELYEYYDKLFKNKKYICKNFELPFGLFITNFQNLYNDIYSNKKKLNSFKKLRWYILFDKDTLSSVSHMSLFSFMNDDYENNDIKNSNIKSSLNQSMSFFGINEEVTRDSYDSNMKKSIYNNFENNKEKFIDLKENDEDIIDANFINDLLTNEDNPLLYFLKLLYLTISLFCKETMGYLCTSFKNDSNFNYTDLFKEYIKRFNNFIIVCEKLNRKCENINVVVNYLDNELLPSYPHFPKFSIFKFCVKIWYNEMRSKITEDGSLLFIIKNGILNLFSDFINEDYLKMSLNPSYISNTSCNSYEPLFNSKGSKFNLSQSFSLINNSNNKTISSIICPFGSYYEEANTHYVILEKSLSVIYETFCDEYSVNLLNLSTIDTNNFYEEIENNIIDIIEGSIKKFFNNSIEEGSNSLKGIVCKIMNYFKGYFYSKKIIPKLKYKIYKSVIITIKNLLFEYIWIKLHSNNFIDCNLTNNNIDNNVNKYLMEINSYFQEKYGTNLDLNKLQINIKKIIDKKENINEIFEDIDNTLGEEIKDIENNDEKIIKELDINNISTSYNEMQRYLLSYSIKTSWENIKKIRTIENYYQKLNDVEIEDFSSNQNTRESLNNLNPFYSVNFENQNNFMDNQEANFNNFSYNNNRFNGLGGSVFGDDFFTNNDNNNDMCVENDFNNFLESIRK